MSQPSPLSDITFSDLGLAPKLLAALTRLKFTQPTLIQQKAIPIAVTGQDVMGIAQTGTGKTLAFALPLVQRIAETKTKGLIILPTRELAQQVDEEIAKIGQHIGLRSAVIVGGASAAQQISQLRKNPHIIIGTPGRMNDLIESRQLRLGDIGVLVLDEADRMLDMGFAPQIKRILQHVPKERQTMLFSATMPAEILGLARQYMKMPVHIEVARAGSVADRVNQELFMVERNHKNRLLDKLLQDYKGTVLVFSRTKHGAKKICRSLKHMGYSAAEIHSNLSLSQRRNSLAGFKRGTFRVLVATDIAARGIDVTDIELVINYDLPDNPEDYVHRVGRTGRAGKVGHAITFIAPDQRSKVRFIEKLVRQVLPFSPLPQLPADRTPVVTDSPSYSQHRRPQHSFRSPRGQAGSSHRGSQSRPTRRGRQVRVHS